MSKIKLRMKKLASDEAYSKFLADLTNASEELENVLKEAKRNEEVYNKIMEDSQALECYNRIVEMNNSIAIQLMGL